MGDLAQLRPPKPNPDYHHPKVSLRVSKAMVATWVRCMVREALNMAVVQEGWAAIINMAVRITREAATALMGLVMAQALMETAIVEGGVLIMGTEMSLEQDSAQ